jgi:hypothetical protein
MLRHRKPPLGGVAIHEERGTDRRKRPVIAERLSSKESALPEEKALFGRVLQERSETFLSLLGFAYDQGPCRITQDPIVIEVVAARRLVLLQELMQRPDDSDFLLRDKALAESPIVVGSVEGVIEVAAKEFAVGPMRVSIGGVQPCSMLEF